MVGAVVKPIRTVLPRSGMEDSPEELTRWGSLGDALQVYHDTLLLSYPRADEMALRHQRWYRWLTMAATIFGAVIVLTAILQFYAWSTHAGRGEVRSVPRCLRRLPCYLGCYRCDKSSGCWNVTRQRSVGC